MTDHERIMNINCNSYLMNHMIQKGIIWMQMMIYFIICDNHMMIIRIIHHDWSWTIMRQFKNIMMIMILFMMIMIRIMRVHDGSWRITMIMIRHDWSKNSLTHWSFKSFSVFGIILFWDFHVGDFEFSKMTRKQQCSYKMIGLNLIDLFKA